MRQRLTAVVAVGASAALVLAGGLTGVSTASMAGQPPAGQHVGTTSANGGAHFGRGGASPWLRALDDPQLPVGTAPKVLYRHTEVSSANPYLAMVPRPGDIRWRFWHRWLKQQSQHRAKAEAKTSVVAPILHQEQEPVRTTGSNDARSNAETLTGFGRGPSQTSAVRILGTLSPKSPRFRPGTTSEDNGSIPKATRTGINKPGEGIRLNSVIGDGPHGSDGDKSGDFDIYKVSAHQGQRITASSKGSDLRTVLVVYQHLRYGWDFVDVGLTSLDFAVPEDGSYYILVAASNTYLRNPLDSGSGLGVGFEGSYNLKLGLGLFDRDFYRVRLDSGDVLGGTVTGRAGDLSVRRPDGTEVFGSHQDASGIYPMDSPLPGGGRATVSYVAEEPGWYSVSTREGSGAYDALLELYRPGAESEPAGATQKIFLDFNGERVNTAV